LLAFQLTVTNIGGVPDKGKRRGQSSAPLTATDYSYESPTDHPPYVPFSDNNIRYQGEIISLETSIAKSSLLFDNVIVIFENRKKKKRALSYQYPGVA
jgi:hypothetical protein